MRRPSTGSRTAPSRRSWRRISRAARTRSAEFPPRLWPRAECGEIPPQPPPSRRDCCDKPTSPGSRYWMPAAPSLFSGGDTRRDPRGDCSPSKPRSGRTLASAPVQRVGSLQDLDEPRRYRCDSRRIRKQLESQQGAAEHARLGGLFGITLCSCSWECRAPGSSPGSWRARSPRWSRAPIGSAKATTLGPLAVVRHDELGDLQFALERMRQKLHETDDHEELSEHGAQQPERRRARDFARRHRQELQRGGTQAARLQRRRTCSANPWSSFVDEAQRAMPSI